MPGKAQREARPAQTCLQNSGITEPNFTKSLQDVEGSSTVLACVSTLRSSLPLSNASAYRMVGYANFRPIGAKIRFPQQSPLRYRSNKVGLILPTHACTYPENLVKIGPEHSQIIGLQ